MGCMSAGLPAAISAPASSGPSALLVLFPRLLIHILPELGLLVRRAEVFGPDVFGVLRERPYVRRRRERLDQDFRILDRDGWDKAREGER